MKIRSGFVSNSSSSSFVLDKKYLTSDEINLIKNFECEVEYWSIEEDEDFVRGFTSMDNGYLKEFIKKQINPPMKTVVNWEGDW